LNKISNLKQNSFKFVFAAENFLHFYFLSNKNKEYNLTKQTKIDDFEGINIMVSFEPNQVESQAEINEKFLENFFEKKNNKFLKNIQNYNLLFIGEKYNIEKTSIQFSLILNFFNLQDYKSYEKIFEIKTKDLNKYSKKYINKK
jgi:hypothetical protein